jgi:site-specific DNA-cytosine methylase
MRYTDLTIASAFSSSGIGMAGYVKAGFVPAYALDFDPKAAAIFDANYRYRDGSSIINVGKVEDVTGADIIAQVKAKTGSEVIHLLEQGPSCHDFTPLNLSSVDFGRRSLMLEALKLIDESQPLIAVIEEVPEFLLPKHRDVSTLYFDYIKKMNYRHAYMVMNSIHYQSNQVRERFIHIFVREDLNKEPVFPQPILGKEKRVKDFLDIDYFYSGHFTDRIKTKNHFMSTVTSGSPKWFWKGDRKWKPTMEELMLCMDLDPQTYKLASTQTAQRQAFGNGIPAMLTYHIGKTLIDKVLCLERDASGIWVPKK